MNLDFAGASRTLAETGSHRQSRIAAAQPIPNGAPPRISPSGRSTFARRAPVCIRLSAFSIHHQLASFFELPTIEYCDLKLLARSTAHRLSDAAQTQTDNRLITTSRNGFQRPLGKGK
jgi:hypothetical protein